MSLARRPMMQELDTLRDRLDRFFQEGPWVSEDGMSLALDVQETDDEIIITASVPGVKPEDLDVDVRHGVLTIQGETTEEREETEGTWHRRERRMGKVYRSLTLPAAVNEEKAEANLEDGVLKVTLPKSDADDRRRIPVQAIERE